MSYEAVSVEDILHDERRSSRRKAVRMRASIGVPAGRTLEGKTVDLSAGGMCVELPFELELGAECTVTLDLAACGSDEVIQIAGHVCYCVPAARGFRVGMQFVRLSTQAAKLIADSLR